ncbi:hypothetical protein ACMHYB_14725 [Sorangium sp. So ce1128]
MSAAHDGRSARIAEEGFQAIWASFAASYAVLDVNLLTMAEKIAEHCWGYRETHECDRTAVARDIPLSLFAR